MCYHPITIINPCKYISVKYHDRFLLQVPCGKCAECQNRKSSEWNYRTYYEFLRTFEADQDSYVYFDTLTYSDEHLPYMNEIDSDLPHLPCFRSKDLTNFFKRLRISLDRKYGLSSDVLSYFACSEYGSKHGRPHYHLLLFIRKPIDSLKLSLLVSKTWSLGRTDGLPYKSSFYVNQHNVLQHSKTGDVIACAKYVTKYVEKDCQLQSVIDERIKNAEFVLGKVKRKGSVEFKKLVRKVVSEVDQFHVQSLHYGELALRDIDMNELVATGSVRMPSHQVVSMLPVPVYCLRKMFYVKHKLNDMYGWQLTDLGLEFKAKRQPILLQQMINRFRSLCLLANVSFDCDKLAHYVMFERGRFRDGKGESLIEERLKSLTHYLYSNQTDKENIGVGVSLEFLGNSALGYVPFDGAKFMKIKDFINQYVYMDSELETQLKILSAATSSIDESKQNYYARLQELKSLFKNIGIKENQSIFY